MKMLNPKLFRGSKEDAFAAIAAKSISCVVNLETETKELIFGGANDEILACIKNGLVMYDFALSGYMPPEIEVVDAIIKLIQAVALTAGSILVHCRKGHERTGFVIAVYRCIVEHWSVDDAIDEWAAEGCSPLWIVMWEDRLRETVKTLRGGGTI